MTLMHHEQRHDSLWAQMSPSEQDTELLYLAARRQLDLRIAATEQERHENALVERKRIEERAIINLLASAELGQQVLFAEVLVVEVPDDGQEH